MKRTKIKTNKINKIKYRIIETQNRDKERFYKIQYKKTFLSKWKEVAGLNSAEGNSFDDAFNHVEKLKRKEIEKIELWEL